MLPEETIKKTLENTTQYYVDILEERQTNPTKHFRKRFKAIAYNRQNEDVATDFTYLSKKTSQGHKGGQFFAGITSKKWSFHPLKKESHNINALQDYLWEYGSPNGIVNDNAQSEVGEKWTAVLRENMIKSRTSKPHNQHQNPAEPSRTGMGQTE